MACQFVRVFWPDAISFLQPGQLRGGEKICSRKVARESHLLIRPARLIRPAIVLKPVDLESQMIGPRLSTSAKRTRLRRSVALTNVALAAVVGAQVLVFGWAAWAVVEMVPAFLAGVVGVWLFYVQHQFEDVYWESGSKWSYADAALQGSS